jgi:glycosyltransferase involved in cell wall biosynthesis
VLAHLRSEKDPLRAALALRFLPADSRVRVFHAGQALTPRWADLARSAERRDPRYQWLGELSRGQAHRLLARSRLLVISSRMEGGANVISEALVEGVPILASRIPGSVGLLGPRYPGCFPVGDTAALANLLRRAETDRRYYHTLERACAARAGLASPPRERNAWRDLLAELVGPEVRLRGSA